MQSVHLSFNKGLTGTIPAELSALSHLTSLAIADSMLTGTIPAELSALSHLTSLDLSSNLLQSPIPSSLGRLTSLRLLNLSNNLMVEGTIPAGVPSAQFPKPPEGDCELGDQCRACTFEACCDNGNRGFDPYCNSTGQRRDTQACRVCGFYESGVCKRASPCADAPWVEARCKAKCTST